MSSIRVVNSIQVVEWALNPWGPPEISVLPSAKDTKAVVKARHWSLLLAEDGTLWKQHSTPSTFYSHVSLPVKVRQVAANASVALILSDNGKLFSFGEDTQRSGLLGLGDCHICPEPRQVLAFSSAQLSQVAIGKTHAAALDSESYLGLGIVYTWGSGTDGQLGQGQLEVSQQTPTRVETSNIFSVKQVICGDTYTCTCTGGGYVYTYGRVGGHMATRRSLLGASYSTPYSVPELEQHYVAFIAGCSSCIIVLSDAGLAFIFDDCAELVRLPTASNVGVKSLVGCGDVILGLSGKA
jgi:alpha-tubulin suppressor-like RCC1 family protein